jgi:hypothetical protein
MPIEYNESTFGSYSMHIRKIKLDERGAKGVVCGRDQKSRLGPTMLYLQWVTASIDDGFMISPT